MTPLVRYAVIAALALALGIGLAPIVGSPSPGIIADPSVSASPAAADPLAPAWVTGTIHYAPSCSSHETTTEGDVQHMTGFRCEPQRWETDDPRLSGQVIVQWNQDIYPVEGGARMVIATGSYQIANEAGRWSCRFEASYAPYRGDLFSGSENERAICTGAGAYAGLTAIVVSDQSQSRVPLTGVIFPGELPPAP